MKALSFARRLVLSLALSVAAVSSVAAAPQPAAPHNEPKVHLIVIGDSDVPDIGRNVGEDARNTAAAFEQAFTQAGRRHQLNVVLMLGNEVREATIRDRIASLDVGPNDALILLYSGHGITLPGGRHCVSFHHDPGVMARADLLEVLQSRNARLTVLLTDVCAGYPRGSGVPSAPSVTEVVPQRLRAGQTIDFRTIESLFLRHSGLVDITASEPGYNARTNGFGNGSHFTNAFLEVLKTPYADLVTGLDRDRDGAVQWDEFLPQLRGEAARRDHAPDRRQQAYARSLGRWTPATATMAP